MVPKTPIARKPLIHHHIIFLSVEVGPDWAFLSAPQTPDWWVMAESERKCQALERLPNQATQGDVQSENLRLPDRQCVPVAKALRPDATLPATGRFAVGVRPKDLFHPIRRKNHDIVGQLSGRLGGR